jgi:hypothetical protein
MSDILHTFGMLNYLIATKERAFFYEEDVPSGSPRTNMQYEQRTLRIQSARGLSPSLDREGFTFCHHQSATTEFHDDEVVRRTYYPEAIELIRQVTDARRVVVFDHTLRRRMTEANDRSGGFRLPAMRVHVDFTFTSAPLRVRHEVPDEADSLLTGRVQIVNLWRPVGGPAVDSPLAVCDKQTMPTTDLVTADLIYNDRKGEVCYGTFNPSHRWYYYPEMKPDEVLLFKNYDSLDDGRARFCAHSAFLDPAAWSGVRPRESIELRAVVVD